MSRADYDRESVPALREFSVHLDGGLERCLRGYMFWLLERRAPDDGGILPDL
jgi:hypothetical protein